MRKKKKHIDKKTNFGSEESCFMDLTVLLLFSVLLASPFSFFSRK